MAFAAGTFRTTRGVMDGALEQRAAKDSIWGGELGCELYLVCGWLALVSSLMMIQHRDNRVNTFFQENVLTRPITSGLWPNGLCGRG